MTTEAQAPISPATPSPVTAWAADQKQTIERKLTAGLRLCDADVAEFGVHPGTSCPLTVWVSLDIAVDDHKQPLKQLAAKLREAADEVDRIAAKEQARLDEQMKGRAGR